MKVLVVCEFSGVVREAFRTRGHQAVSCDLLETEIAGPHIVGDCLDVLGDGWDMLIGHPPCTALAVSGARWFKDRRVEQRAAVDFFLALWFAPIPRIALENPVGVLSTFVTRPDQIIHPWQFGHEESKKTCLWLKNLPPLAPTKVMMRRDRNLTKSGQNRLPPSKDRWKLRSRTYEGIARAMAEQWGG